MAEARYVPAAGRFGLTGLYDPSLRLTMRESRWRPALVAAAGTGDVLDLGCGTGTLAVDLARAGAHVIGVDGDEDVLRRAAAKARDAGVAVELRAGLADAIPLADASVDAVVCSLLLHHLSPADKAIALRECRRVLRPGGRLLVADWGRPADPLQRALFGTLRLIDGRANTRAHAEGRLTEIVRGADFAEVTVERRVRTGFGTLELVFARR